MQLAVTAQRVARNTSPASQKRIRESTLARIERALGEDRLDQELSRLQREWDTERVLETNAACLLLASLGLGVFRDRRWLWLAGGVSAFLLQHALQGWCPPLPVLRALGVRTAGEIGAERAALKTLRGDFHQVPLTAEAAFQAATLE